MGGPETELGTAWDRALKPGVAVGRFEMVREVGRGGFGVVYEARDSELGRTVAFKAVRAGGRPDVREERLLREAEAAARLSHPNIVTLFDVGRSEHGPYLVLEFLRGQTLARRLGQGPLSVAEALRIAVEVAKGLAHAHAQGVVHRDLTPGNVFLCDDGQVKVLDLGMAHAFGRRRLDGGTPGYMAPEQREGAPEDERTDVFALGVILYRMLAGELPFPGGDARSSKPPSVLDVLGAPAMGELIARMLDPTPVKRPRDAGEVLQALSVLQKEIERIPSAADFLRVRKRWHLGRRLALLGAAGAFLGIAAAVVVIHSVSERFSGASIAVLPFADMSPQHDQEYFADGIAEEILNALARVDGLRVPGRTSSFYFKGKNVRLTDVGRDLKVGTVLEGSIRKEGNRIRVTAQVVDVADGHHLWSSTFDRELTGVFAVQDEIAREVVTALRIKLLPGKSPTTGSYVTPNPEVYRLFLLGRQFYTRYSQENFRRAVEAYEKALALDPGYAPAWAGLAVPLDFLSRYAETPESAEALRRRALEAAEKAVALSPDLPDALSSRGFVRLKGHDWHGAKADLERAVLLHPGDTDARRRYAILLGADGFGRLTESIAVAEKAVELDPLSPASWGQLGWAHLYADQYDRAVASFRRAVEVSPEAQLPRIGLGQSLVLLGRSAEALPVFDGCPDEGDRLLGHAVAQHALGHAGESQAALDAFISRRGKTRALDVAWIHAWRGEKDEAFRWLERAFAQGPVTVEIRFDPFLHALRDDPRFSAFVKRTNPPVP